MGVDKGYGSGKPRSAANSRARQRVASGSFTKGPTKTNRALKKIAAQNPVTGFIGGGVLASKGFVSAFNKASSQVGKAFHRDLGAGFSKKSIGALSDKMSSRPSSSAIGPVSDAIRDAVGNRTYEVWRRGVAANMGRLGSKEFNLTPAQSRGLGGSNAKDPSVRLIQNTEGGIINRGEAIKVFPRDRSKLKAK
jgi:hypothetical protein